MKQMKFLMMMAKRRKLKDVKKLQSLGSVSRKVVENVMCSVILLDVEISKWILLVVNLNTRYYVSELIFY